MNLPKIILDKAEQAKAQTLPAKSRNIYEKEFESFNMWSKNNDIQEPDNFSEEVLLAYFDELSKKLVPTSLWSIYSILKKMIALHSKIRIDNYFHLINFIKNKNQGYEPTKAKVFTDEEIDKFLNTAPDLIYLDIKVVLIFGLLGALRTDELLKVERSHVEKHGDLFLVKVPIENKTKQARSFTISDKHAETVQKYLNLRPSGAENLRFFINYQKGTCTRQVIGKNKFSQMPCKVAEFLNLPEPKKYTGHSWRRTSASLASNKGADTDRIQSLGGWKSAKVARSYVENSIRYKKQTENFILPSTNEKNNEVPDKPQDARLEDNFISLSRRDPVMENVNLNETVMENKNLYYLEEQSEAIPEVYILNNEGYQTEEVLNEVPIIFADEHVQVDGQAQNLKDSVPPLKKQKLEVIKKMVFKNCSNVNIHIH